MTITGLALDASAATADFYTLTVWDSTYGAAGTANGFRAVMGQAVQVVAPVAINPAALTDLTAGAAAVTYTATGGSADPTYVWTTTNTAAGTIDQATGVFTPAALTTGSEVTTLRATDPAYGTIYDEIQVTVYAGLSLTLPAGYSAADATTYPLLAGAGTTYTVTANDGTAAFTWSVYDAGQTLVATGAGAQYVVDADTLFANGAGVYTVEAKDDTLGTTSEILVKVPMRIAPLTGNYTDAGASAVFTVTGNAGPFTWTVTDELGTLIATPTFGAYTDATNAATNYFDFTAATTPITAPTAFRARALSGDAALAAAGLDVVLTDSQVVVPVVTLTVTVLGSDAPAGITGAVVTAVHDTTITATSGAGGVTTLAGLENVGAAYVFIVTAPGYAAGKLSVSDLTQAQTITLQAITTPEAITGTVAPPAGAGATVKAMNQEGTFINDGAGSAIEALADAAGNFTLDFDTANAGTAPYTVCGLQDRLYHQ